MFHNHRICSYTSLHCYLTDEYGKIVGLQEADDALENVNLADADRKTEREKTIKRNRQPIYSALDDYEFQEGVEPGTKAPILPQYEKEKKSCKFPNCCYTKNWRKNLVLLNTDELFCAI